MPRFASRHVNRDEADVRIDILNSRHRFAEQIARADDNLRAVGNSLINGVDALIRAVSRRLIVLALQIVGFGIGDNALPASLVEGLIVDGSDVGNERDIGSQSGRRDQREQRGQNEQCGKDLFHDTFLLS